MFRRGCFNAWLAVTLFVPALALAQTAGIAPAPAAAAIAPAASSVDPESYVIGAGDTLQIFVWRNPDLTATVPVRPDGKIDRKSVV